MRHAAQDSQLSKVLVQCDKNALLRMSLSEDHIVARIERIPNPYDIVASGTNLFCGWSPDAGVQENLHVGVPTSIVRGSNRS